MDRSRLNKSRFTLIELLAVVALISMLMAVGVPAFARMIRGSRVDESARNIKLALEQAQMRAASERCYVAVIFPNGPDASVDSTLHSYRMGGFRTAYVRKNGSSYTFIRWVEGSDWSNAPDGAVLIKVGTSTFTATDGYVKNCPSASTAELTSSSTLMAVDGVRSDNYDSNGNAPSIDVGNHCAIIFTPYGSVVGSSKLYLLVSEALIEGTSITYPTAKDTGENKYTTANYRVLKVNNLTGRVEFEE